MALSSDNIIYVAGYFDGTATFLETTYTSTGGYDAWIIPLNNEDGTGKVTDNTVSNSQTINNTNEIQDISISGSTLSISDGSSLDLSSIDDQTIDEFSISGAVLSLSLENDGENAKTVDLSTLSSINFQDTDGDTKIQLEASSDDDIIRFDMQGTEFMRIDSGRIEVVNTGNSVFIGEEAGLYDDFSNNRNVFIGYRAGKSNQTGDRNVLMGYQAGQFYYTAFRNVALGYRAGYQMTTGHRNTFLGYQAGYTNQSGERNVFLGYNAGYNETGDHKLYIENTNSAAPLIYGDFDIDSIAINGDFYVTGNADGATPWGNTSDQRFKTDIQTIPNALDKVLQMRGVTYQWKDGREKGDRMGFIAQEVAPVLPEVVDTSKNHLTMQYAPITAVLIEAVKDQQELIEQLKKENEELKMEVSKIREQNQRINALEAKLEALLQNQK